MIQLLLSYVYIYIHVCILTLYACICIYIYTRTFWSTAYRHQVWGGIKNVPVSSAVNFQTTSISASILICVRASISNHIYIHMYMQTCPVITHECTSIPLIKIIEFCSSQPRIFWVIHPILSEVYVVIHQFIHEVSFLLLTVSLHVYCLQIPHVNQSLFPWGII